MINGSDICEQNHTPYYLHGWVHCVVLRIFNDSISNLGAIYCGKKWNNFH
jgi:hypothetical protein